VTEYFSFVSFFFSTLFAKVFFLSQTSHKEEHVPSLQHEVEFYWLESCQNSESMSDFLINEKKVPASNGKGKCTSNGKSVILPTKLA